MQAARKTRWQQATALVSLSTCGAMTGLAFAHGSVADLTSPTSMPLKLMALTKPAASGAAGDTALRSAIVRAAQYYLRLAQSQSPAAMEALIWQNDSLDGVDHGESCAAFASLMLESGARATGQQSWVTGGTTYPWPVHAWVDSRVDPNPGSPGVTSVLQDAQAHQRWHPLGDGYTPQPGDWVLFDGHVEVVTKYAAGVLYTIGGDSSPNLSVNAHEYQGPLAAQGVAGFVNNGTLLSTVSQTPGGAAHGSATQSEPAQAARHAAPGAVDQGQANIPGTAVSTVAVGTAAQAGGQEQSGSPAQPGGAARSGGAERSGGAAQSGRQAQQAESVLSEGAGAALTDKAAIPGVAPITGSVTSHAPVTSGPRYSRSQPAATTPKVAGSAAQQAFINEIAPGALAAQQQYGIPAAVTIAQAIDESGWGQSQLAAQNHNLFGIKGAGPAGSVQRPTQEFENGQFVTVNAQFRVYKNVAQSITDHGLLLATGSSYRQAMADRRSPDAFANALTGVYATDPNYGANLITIMRQYNLYRFDGATPTVHGTAAANGSAAATGRATASGSAGASGRATASGTAGASGRAAAGRPERSGSAPEGSGSGRAQAAAQSGAIGPTAAIPGAVPVNAAALGLAATPTPGHGAAGQRASGHPGPVHGRSGQGAPVGRSSAPGASARPSSAPSSSARPSSAPSSSAAPSGTRPSSAPSSSTAPRSPRPSSAPSSSTAPRSPRPSSTAPSSRAPSSARPSGPAAGSTPPGGARIPGFETPATTPAGTPATTATSAYVQPTGGPVLRAGPRNVRISTRRYAPQMPRIVLTDFVTTAKVPLLRAKPIYQDVAANSGVHWPILAACDWMQCQAHPRVSPVYGEPLGAKNPDGTRYRTKSDALEQCAADLIELAAAVYGIDLTRRLALSVRDLANVFASFRWGSLLKAHRISAMEFPYSVEGLTAQHMKMRWPDIDEEAPDKPGTRFRRPFGAVPVVLGLGYPALA